MSSILKNLPLGPEAHIGFELEFDLKGPLSDELRLSLQAVYPGAQVFNEPITWARSPNMGYEFTMCCPIGKYAAPIHEVCRLLIFAKEQAFVDDRCGLHVHLDARVVPADELRRRLQPHKEQIKKFCSAERLANPRRWYPDPLWVRNRYRTLEVRFMEGHFDADRAIAYIDTLVELSNLRATAPAPQPGSAE